MIARKVIKMEYKLRLFYNTGFDTINVPYSASVLESSADAIIDGTTNYLVQNTDFTSLRIATTFEQIKGVDYLQVGSDSFYQVTGISMISPACAELSLQQDYLLSLSGKLDGFSATAQRITPVNKDDYNFLSEPFNPTESLNVVTTTTVGGSNEQYEIVGSTVDLYNITNTAEAFNTDEGETVLYVPQLPTATESTRITEADSGRSYRLPNETLYGMVDANIKKALISVQSLGISDSIMDRYSLPKEWAEVDYRASGVAPALIENITSKTGEINIGIPDYGSENYYPKNAKANILYAQYLVIAEASGDNNTFPWDLIKNPDKSVTFKKFADPSPNGKPYIRPKLYQNSETNGVEQAVAGASWYHPQMVLTGAVGSAIRNYNDVRASTDVERLQSQYMANQNMALARTASSGILGAIKSGLSLDILGGVSTAINTGLDATQNEIDRNNRRANDLDALNDRTTATNIANNVYTPTIKTAQGDSLQNLTGNSFKIRGINLTKKDMQLFDKYLTKYGYAVPNEVITLSDLSRGREFCYLQASEISFTGTGAPRYMRLGLIEQLIRGVRIWRVKPNTEVYTNGN